jgi:hypothetical protein
MPDITKIINTDRYPLDKLDDESSRGWISEVRQQLEDTGSCACENFVRPECLAEMAKQANSITRLAYAGPIEVSPYFFNYRLGEGEVLADAHPLRRKGRRNLAQVAADLIPEDFLLTHLYRSNSMIDFLAAIIGQPVYQNADPYQSLNLSVMNRGGCQQWHFDSGTMVTTLLLQEPDDGGVFEYVPAIRSVENENFAAVQQVLDGNRERVRQIKLKAGTLSLFRGHFSLHRVTEVLGDRQRLQAILGYTTKPGMKGSIESSILHYGPRVAEIEAVTPRYAE